MTTRRKFLKQLGITALGSLFASPLLAMFMPKKETPIFRGMQVPGYKVLKPEALGRAGDPVALTKDNVAAYIAECGRILDEQAIPESGRMLATDKGIFKSDGTFTPWEGA